MNGGQMAAMNVVKKKAYVKAETLRVELSKDILDSCSYDDIIKSSTGNTTIGWKTDQSIVFLVIKDSADDEPGDHYYFIPNSACTYRFTNGNGGWASCNWDCTLDGTTYDSPCEYNVVGSCSVQESCDGGATWNNVTLTSWSGAGGGNTGSGGGGGRH